MNQETCLESLKQMLGDAIMLGMQISNHNYEGLLQDEKNQPLMDGIDRLHQSTQKFLAVSPFENVSAEQIFPLYEEIQQLSQNEESP